MNTSAITSPAAVVQSAPQAGKQPDAASGDVPFNQVLSHEIANRDNSGDNSNAAAKDSAGPNAPAPTQAQAPAKPDKAADKDKTKDSANSDQSNGAAATTSATDMLALVANVGQMNASLKDTAAASAASTAADAAQLAGGKLSASIARVDLSAHADGKQIAVSAQAAGRDRLQGAAAGDTAAAAGAAAAKPDAEFAAALKQPADGDAAKLQASQAELTDAALASAAAKARDVPTAPAVAALAPLQAAVTGVQMATGAVPEKLAPQVGTPAWDQALGQKVVWMVAGGQQSASLTLNPPDLGPLQVVLNVSNSQANATFIAAQPEVRHALEAALPKLREMMGDAGIQLGQATVSTGTPNQHGGFGESQQRSSRSFEPGADGAADSTVRAVRSRTISSGQGLVDTFA